MNNLKITLIQTDLHWEDKEKNLEMLSVKIAGISEATDLILLPEMFSTGFSMRPKVFAENMNGPTVVWMKAKAKEKNAVIAGSFICEEGGKYFNRLAWVKPDGSYNTYDKRHLFSMGDEDDHYTKGTEKLIVELNGWKICPLICYDLRFPVWSRNKLRVKSPDHGENTRSAPPTPDYDVLIYVANWPERRSHPWRSLLVARAIENQSYVIGVNRVGMDGNEIFHCGDSIALNFKGEGMTHFENSKERTETVTLKHSDLRDFRDQFPVFNDADDFKIN